MRKQNVVDQLLKVQHELNEANSLKIGEGLPLATVWIGKTCGEEEVGCSFGWTLTGTFTS